MRYVPALDGLRALAALTVLAHHAYVPGFANGNFGVDVFFVLSGFLITQALSENPGLLRFYWRRAKRLIPALALMLAAYLLVFPLALPHHHHHGRDALLAMFYLSDYSYTFWKMPRYLAHTWSLSVEEHFYLLWPLVFVRWRPTMRVLLVAFVVFTAWRLVPEWELARYRFDTRLSGLMLGCALAFVRLNVSAAWGLGALVALLAFLPADSRQGGLVLVELAAAVAVVGRHPAWVGQPWLAYLGKLSYGIYLWHYPITRLMDGQPWQATLAVTLPLSIALAALSYHTVEAWVRSARRGERLPEVNEVVNTGARSRSDGLGDT